MSLRLLSELEVVAPGPYYLVRVHADVDLRTARFAGLLDDAGLQVYGDTGAWSGETRLDQWGRRGVSVVFFGRFAREDTVRGWSDAIGRRAGDAGAAWAWVALAEPSQGPGISGLLPQAREDARALAQHAGDVADRAADVLGTWSLSTVLLGVGAILAALWLWRRG